MVRVLTQTVSGVGLSSTQSYILFTFGLFMRNKLFNNTVKQLRLFELQ